MELANAEAKRFNHEYIGTEHILLGLVKEDSGVAANVLKNLDIDLRKIRSEVEKLVQSGPDMVTPGKLPQTPRAKKVIEYAVEEARILNHTYTGTEHILLGLLCETEGVAAQVLMNLGLKLEQVRAEILNLLGHTPEEEEPDDEPERTRPSKTPALDSFSRDLTAMARENKLDPVVGRERELGRVLQILCRRHRNHPVLLGQPGVGKRAVVEGLAQRIVCGEVPDHLLDARVVKLDLALLVAGTENRGAFEKRMTALIAEFLRSKVILFIDDFRLLARAGGFRSGMDAARILCPVIRRGELRCLGTATRRQYREHVEENVLIESQFEIVPVEPPSPEVALDILQALRHRFEQHHGLKITDDALALAVELSSWYHGRRCLPDSAINVIDDCCSRRRLNLWNEAPRFQALDAEVKRLTQEKEEAIVNQQFDRAAALREQADKLKQEREATMRQWRQLAGSQEVVDADAVVETLSELTGLGPDEVRKIDRTSAPRHAPDDVVTGLPGYERRQCESIFRGGAVRITRGTGLVLLPRAPGFREVFDAAISPAMSEHGIRAVLAEELSGPGPLVSQSWSSIRSAEVIVADVTGLDPSVMFTLGLCLGVPRLPILLLRDPQELPLDLQVLRYLKYEPTPAGIDALRQELSAALRAFLAASRRSLAGD
jgi:ATP-dependent Clp protease ATP-binding subunit ClpC